MTDEQLAAYCAAYPDVALSGLSPREHWERVGVFLGRTLPSNPTDSASTSGNNSERPPLSATRLAAFVHLYYRDLWDEIAEHLENIPLHFDLYVTVCEDHGSAEELRKAISLRFPQSKLLCLPNRGLDCAPFVEAFRHALNAGNSYTHAIKLHTKRSLGSDPVVGEWWRKKTYDCLLGSPEIVLNILRRFSVDDSLGMIGPSGTRMSVSVNDLANGSNVNHHHFARLASAFDIKDSTLDFFGGTMFWFRWECLARYFDKPVISISDYEPGYRVDGLLAHGMERILASMVRESGHSLYEQDYIHDVLSLKNTRKTICFIHPGFGIGGGNRVLFDLAGAFSNYYNVYSASYMGNNFSHWMDVRHPVASFSSSVHVEEFLRVINCDYVFATGWQTFEFVNKLSSNYKKFYFIQDYEAWFAGGENASQTYCNSFDGNFVIAKWLQSKLQKDHGLHTTFVRLGVNQSWSPIATKSRNHARNLLCYHKIRGHRGRGADLIEAFLRLIVKANRYNVRVIGHEDPEVAGAVFLGELSGAQLQAAYAEADVFVDLSRHRGIATMAMEMACYGTVPILSAPEYGLEEYGFLNHESCLLADSPDDAVRQALLLGENPDLFARLSNSVKLLATTFNYPSTIRTMIPVINNLCR